MLRCVQTKIPAFTRGLRGALPEVAKTLDERLAALHETDSEVDARVNIGYSKSLGRKQREALEKERRAELKTIQRNNKLRDLCSTGDFKIDLDLVKTSWRETDFGQHVLLSADHYNIVRDLFDFGYFLPAVHLKVDFPLSNDECSPVHYGNIISCADSASVPDVTYPADPGHLFTLVMTSLDSHLESTESEYLHWMVGNIPGNDISKGTTLCEYMRPFVPKGSGYHRFAFLLFRQEKEIEFSKHRETIKGTCLRKRTFRTIDFYRGLEDEITPCGLSFFQSDWDDCLVDFFHNELGIKIPVFEHVPLEPVEEKFKKYPENESFNEYIDKFRDPKEIAEDIYCRRLKKLDPFKEEVPETKYPHAHPMSLKLASWIRAEQTQERERVGKFKHMKRFSLHPEGYKQPYKKVRVKVYDL
ncbi:39S ribosomal protein L38, mitochondrial [Galendromus occidentalis]|uniref:Large ribosomal subunit protein mL38 n=1 Tax=Galendromus occidentalis TaxID=34638 RepID=A0AAJ6QQP8_9ACAR|nr:39S ribosomal protein L38, mitochondrial [Galendromus occidentalis]